MFDTDLQPLHSAYHPEGLRRPWKARCQRMRYNASCCMLLLCCLQILSLHTEARPVRQRASAQSRSVSAHGPLKLPLPGGGSATLHDAYVQGAGHASIAPPPPISTYITCSQSPLTLTDTETGVVWNTTSVNKSETATATVNTDIILKYNGGELMSSGANVYMIYVGYEATDKTPLWLNYLVANLGSTRWWAVMQSYAVGGSTFSTDITLAGVTYIPHVRNNSNEQTAVPSIVNQAIAQQLVAKDIQKGIYVVVSAPNKGLPTCQEGACGYHDALKSGIKYAYMTGGCSNGCTTADVSDNGKTSPTGDATLDGVCVSLVHELAETVTDPVINGWTDSDGFENGDECAWDFGALANHTLPTGRKIVYNQIVGGYPFLLQRIWDPKPVGKSGQQVGCVYGV